MIRHAIGAHIGSDLESVSFIGLDRQTSIAELSWAGLLGWAGEKMEFEDKSVVRLDGVHDSCDLAGVCTGTVYFCRTYTFWSTVLY